MVIIKMIGKIVNPYGENYDVNNIDELITTMGLLETTIYYGYDKTQPYAWLWAKKHDARIKIAYDDVFDCKQTELAIRPFCSKFSQRKTSFTPLSSIGVSEDCKQELNNMKSPYESYEMVIWRLLLEHYGKI